MFGAHKRTTAKTEPDHRPPAKGNAEAGGRGWVAANQREAAQTQMAMQNNLTQNQAYLSAMQGALQLYGMPNLATNQAVAGMFV